MVFPVRGSRFCFGISRSKRADDDGLLNVVQTTAKRQHGLDVDYSMLECHSWPTQEAGTANDTSLPRQAFSGEGHDSVLFLCWPVLYQEGFAWAELGKTKHDTQQCFVCVV